MVKYEDVQDQSTDDYFNGNQFSIDAFNKKYRLHETETYVQAVKRVCDFIASVEETKELQQYWSEKWFDEIYNDWWHPAGSIMQGANSGKKISLANCITISLGTNRENEEWDNLESIIRNTAYTVAKAAAFRQGLGADFSRLRPIGASILNSANKSTGPIHWMKLIDSLGYYVGQNGRIPAMLFSLSCSHPDVLEFIKCKEGNKSIQNANISIQCTDKFYDAVEKDKEWKLEFTVPSVKKGDKIYVDSHSATDGCEYDKANKKYYYLATHDKKKETITKTVRAREMLELIAQHNWKNGDPGIQNIDIARYYSNSDYIYDANDYYDSRIVSSNACCLDGDSTVTTNYGYHTIKSIYESFHQENPPKWKALSYNLSTKQFEFKSIVNAWQLRTDHVILIETTGSTPLYCSFDHPILTPDGYVKAEDLKIGDKIVGLYQSEVIWINKLDTLPKRKLYDIEVKHNHNFVVGNNVVKNSEQYLSRDSLCILSSINMGKFSTKPDEYDTQLQEIGKSVNRFLDNVNEAELKYQTYATPMQKIAIEKLRRTGAGITNIGEWLFKQGLNYGESQGNIKLGKFVERYNYYLYQSSITLGKEKGNFGLFNREKLEKSPFIQHMIGLGLKFTSLRNVTCSSVAPTGTLSLMFRNYVMSYGIEPSFGMYYWKRTRMSGKYDYYFCVPQVVIDTFKQNGYDIPIQSNTIKDTWDGYHGRKIAKYIDEYKDSLGIHFKNPEDISITDKIALMSAISPNIDSSISTTYMMNPEGSWKDIYDLILLAHKNKLKSITAMPDKKIYGIVSRLPFKDLAQHLHNQNIPIHQMNFTEEEFNELYGHGKTLTKDARPQTLKCNVHHTTVKGQKYFVLVGLWSDGTPYEVFSGKNGFLSPNIKTGHIIRKRKNFYKAVFDDPDETELSPITACMSDHEETFSRLISMSLRSGADMNLVVGQLEKIGDDMHNFAKCISRALKQYIPDNTSTGEECPDCGNELIRIAGCKSCSCGYSLCL